MQIKGFMIDSARCMENRDYYRRLIRFCASKGLNAILWHFSDDQGLSLDFPSEPGLASKHAYSAIEMRELIAYAQERGVTIIPELETLGHSRYITRQPQYVHLCESEGDFTAICPLHPETRSLMKRLVADVAELFPSPWIHVGLDEIKLGGHALTQEALKTRTEAELLAEYATFIYDEVKTHARRMIMWVDQNSYNTGFMHDLPKDIVIAVWQYHPDVTPELAQSLLDAGFNVLLCPALITYDQQAYPGQIALPNIEKMSQYQKLTGKAEIAGVMTTIWTPMRYLHDALWPGLSVAADMMLSEGAVHLSQSLEHHIFQFHGAKATTEVLDALVLSFEIAPERKEYLSILKADTIELDDETLNQRALEWVSISQQVANFLPYVKNEYAALDTLRMFTSWMGYLYRRAAVLQRASTLNEDWERLMEEGEDWLAKLERIWDCERFSDDDRKISPVYEWEEKEYLLINFRKSLQVVGAFSKDLLVTSN